MAHHQIDPSRLESAALGRWYLRSPQEVERERLAAAGQQHQDFFGITMQGQAARAPAIQKVAAINLGLLPRIEPDGSQVQDQRPSREARLSGTYGEQLRGTYRPPAAAGIADCVSCHGRVGPPPPLPFPWRDRPAMRDTPRTPPSGPPSRQPKQCDIQHGRDTEVCNGQPNPTARAMCHSSAMERYARCIKTGGEVGWPPLFTHPNGPRR